MTTFMASVAVPCLLTAAPALSKNSPSFPPAQPGASSPQSENDPLPEKYATATPALPQSQTLEFGTVSTKGDSKKSEISSNDSWRKLYEAAVQDLEARRYEVAEDRINASLKAARLGTGDSEKLMLSRITLAEIFFAREKYSEAEKIFSSCLSIARHIKGADSSEVASCEEGLASIALLNDHLPRAETLASNAMGIRLRVMGPSRATAKSMLLMSGILSRNNWVDESEATALDGVKMLQEFPGENNLDLADAYRQTALLFHDHGKTAEAQDLFERRYKIIDASAKLNKPAYVEGQLVFHWEAGSPRSQEIPDADFPLKYLQVDNVRIAATVIDLWELYGVLISVTNTGDERINAGLGKPALYGAPNDNPHARMEKLENIDPLSIDRIRRERTMWDLTMTRPWLANMQKTRSQRGFVPQQGHDLFRGPNVFGIYGEWNALPRELPAKLMLEPSPERVQYQAEPIIDPGLVRSSTIKLRNLVPISLEPFESRTGELFYLNPRNERLLLTVPVGNVLFQIPFSAKRKRIN